MNKKYHLFGWKNHLGNVMLSVIAFSVIMAGCANTKICTISDNSKWMCNDSVIEMKLGKEINRALFMPDITKCYHIIYEDSASVKNKVSVVDSYVRDSLLASLNVSQVSVLQFLLLSNPENYATDSINVQSPYLPSLEFEFVKEDTTVVSVVVSTLDHSWQIVKNGKQLMTYNFVDTKNVERFCKYFLDMYNSKTVKK